MPAARSWRRAGAPVISASRAGRSIGTLSTTGSRSVRARWRARAASADAVCGRVHALGDRAALARDRRLVDLEVRPLDGRRRVGRQQQRRRAGLGRLHQAGQGVREPGALVRRAHGDAVRHAPVAVGHHHGAALVPRCVEGRAGIAQLVREQEVARADDAEDGVDSSCHQGARDDSRDAHPHASVMRGA